jgi:hypothetical protein
VLTDLGSECLAPRETADDTAEAIGDASIGSTGLDWARAFAKRRVADRTADYESKSGFHQAVLEAFK